MIRSEIMSKRRARGPRGFTSSRGFTLVELMVVVTLVGVLAAIGIASFRKEIAASKTTEATAVVQAIRGAQETYRSENQVYLDVTTNSANWYPSNVFGEVRQNFRIDPASHTDGLAWAALNVSVTQPVQFRYLVDAGGPGVAPPALVMPDPPTLAAPPDPWYLIQARANYDGDSVFCDVVAWSHSREVYVQNEGE